jgi:hypothetical protein
VFFDKYMNLIVIGLSLMRMGHMLFVPDIFSLERTNGIEEISQYSDFDL